MNNPHWVVLPFAQEGTDWSDLIWLVVVGFFMIVGAISKAIESAKKRRQTLAKMRERRVLPEEPQRPAVERQVFFEVKEEKGSEAMPLTLEDFVESIRRAARGERAQREPSQPSVRQPTFPGAPPPPPSPPAREVFTGPRATPQGVSVEGPLERPLGEVVEEEEAAEMVEEAVVEAPAEVIQPEVSKPPVVPEILAPAPPAEPAPVLPLADVSDPAREVLDILSRSGGLADGVFLAEILGQPLALRHRRRPLYPPGRAV